MSISNLFSVEYKSRLRDYHARASVRKLPIRDFEVATEGLPFSPDLIPVLSHPMVQARSPKEKRIVMAQKLFTYLRFTEVLELLAVIPSSTDLRFGNVPFHVPPSLKRDAGKIVTDEAHHADCAAELTEQIAAATADEPYRLGTPGFLNKLRATEERFVGCTRNLAALTFTAVSETLITGTLTDIPKDTRVHPTIRAVITDHSRDEARHHACFSDVIRIMWTQLTTGQKDQIGPLFGEFIETFLQPDVCSEVGWLEAAGFDAREARKIIEETYDGFNLSLMYRDAAKPTIRMMQQYGMTDHPATFDALAIRGLLDPQ